MAHFASGGIPVDLNAKTQLPGLYAVGEVACTGVHGANRLASNALLEGMVFAERLANSIESKEGANDPELVEGSRLQKTSFENPPTLIIEPLPEVKAYAKRLGKIMWEHAGIIRSADGYAQARVEIDSIPSRDIRIHHRKLVAKAILDACAKRRQSVGGHYVI
ncbi:FAD-binding protein [Candidatus Peregrinibacteria bacterium]|nr:MAG: FAD-binding protein [Candidatus Peregrinibacteria bacterium]